MRQPRHAILLSGDVGFMAAMELSFRETWTDCPVSRVHPNGDLTALKFQEARELLIVQDLRQRYTSEISALIESRVGLGAELLLISAIPLDLKIHENRASIAHNLRWDSPKIGHAVVLAYGRVGFAGLEARTLSSRAGHMKVLSATDKKVLIEELSQTLERSGVQRTRRGKISAVADELLMNALYHGPSGGPKVRLPEYPETPLPGGAVIDVSWSLDKETFQLSVRDPFGTLGADVLQRRLNTFGNSESIEITRTGGRGGGVGLYTILRNSTAFYAFVDRGRLSEVSVCVALRGEAQLVREKSRLELVLFFL